jgi:hypothetical protein
VRLDAVVDSEGSMLRNSWVVGKVRMNSVRLRKRIWYSNSWQTFLFARFVPKGSGTLIVGRYGVHWGTQILEAIIFTAMFIAIVLSRGEAGLIIILGFIVAMAVVCRFLARNEGDFLLQFLVKAIRGRRVERKRAARGPKDRLS